MVCYKPLQGFFSYNEDGTRYVKFSSELARAFTLGKDLQSIDSDAVSIPCGRCEGCRLERSRQWAVRCMHEASMYERNCFITLTYDEDHLPSDFSLDKSHFQLFMKRLRKRFGEGIRFYHCGEYGERFGRPHYHALIFNFDFDDKVFYKLENGVRTYVSDTLTRLWGKGLCVIGSVTFKSAAYVARYIMKKVTGPDSVDYYKGRLSEYTTMSRRPGIGKSWFDKFKSDVYPKDYFYVDGVKSRPPRFYDALYELEDPNGLADIKVKRVEVAASKAKNSTYSRLKVRYECLRQRLKKLVRNVD